MASFVDLMILRHMIEDSRKRYPEETKMLEKQFNKKAAQLAEELNLMERK